MSRIELYTPWREDRASIVRRTVGREALRRRILQSADELQTGGRPLPLYLFGPRGAGKSHVVALLRPELEARGATVLYVPEDVAAIRSAQELLDASAHTAEPSWMRWAPLAAERSPPTYRSPRAGPVVLVVEALDRRLRELGSSDSGRLERQKLRHAWSSDGVWVIATGVELGNELTDHVEPFYGFFDPEPLELLSDGEAGELLDRVVRVDLRDRACWPGRRSALVALAGGSPRVLVTLAETCAGPEGPEAATTALLAAVDRFTPHFQLRFRDLPPFGQHVVELLALAPRAMNPGEMAIRLGTSPPSLATQTRRLADDGVLRRVEEGRSTWYVVAEPLFRYWLEYRTAPWETTRIALASSLLDVLFSPDEIVERWFHTPDDPLLAHAVRTGRSAGQLLRHLWTQIDRGLDADDGEAVRGAFAKAVAAGEDNFDALSVSMFLTTDLGSNRTRPPRAYRLMADCLDSPSLTAALQFAAAVREGAGQRRVLGVYLRDRPLDDAYREWVASRVVLEALNATARPGAPWKPIGGAEGRSLARLPFLRAELLVSGRLRSHPPILNPDLLPTLTSDDPDLAELLTTATMLGSGSLTLQVLTARALHRLPPNPVPFLPVPAGADLLAAWITDPRSDDLETTLSWARSFAEVDDDAFATILTRLASRFADLPLVDSDAAALALVAFGAVSPGRLEEVGRALPAAYADRALRAQALLEQLREPRLHPELARIRDALAL